MKDTKTQAEIDATIAEIDRLFKEKEKNITREYHMLMAASLVAATLIATCIFLFIN